MVYFSPLTERIWVQEIWTTETLKISPLSVYLFRMFNKIYNLIKNQNTRFNLQMTTGILQNKLILIQEKSPGGETNKGNNSF